MILPQRFIQICCEVPFNDSKISKQVEQVPAEDVVTFMPYEIQGQNSCNILENSIE